MSGVNPIGIGLFPPVTGGPLGTPATPTQVAEAFAIAPDPDGNPNTAIRSSIYMAKMTLSNPQILALSATPQVIVPGTIGALLVPLAIFARMNLNGGTGNYNTTVNTQLRYTGLATAPLTINGLFSNGVATTAQQLVMPALGSYSFLLSQQPADRALEVVNSGAITGGHALYTAVIWLLYLRMALP